MLSESTLISQEVCCDYQINLGNTTIAAFKGRGEILNISRKGGEPYGGTWYFIGDLDNHLETMLYYLTLTSLCVAIYTFPIT